MASCASAARLARPKTGRQSGFLHTIRLGKNEGSTRWERSQSQKCGDTATVKNDRYNEEWSGRRGSNSQLSAWEAESSLLYFQYLQNRSEKMHVHALHTVHALP